MRYYIEVTEQDVRVALQKWLEEKIGGSIPLGDIRIEVKSKQNYKSEWEVAAFRGVMDGDRS